MVLPFEHQGQDASNDSRGRGHEDRFEDRQGSLQGRDRNRAGRQAIAVGEQAAAATLGSILYVRDSDDEGGLHDSDEDPDDDLDL